MTEIPDIRLQPATDAEYPVVAHLIEYYLYDFTEFLGWRCPESGQFIGSDVVFAEWRAGKNYPFLLRVDGELAGFAIVGIEEAARAFVMREFFILRKFRRRGIGQAVATQLFDQFAGDWQVEFFLANTPARQFWPRVVRTYLGDAAPAAEDTASTWGPRQVLRFTHPVPAAFDFLPVPALHAGELTLLLDQMLPPYPARAMLPCYDFTMQVDGQYAGRITLRVGNTPDILLYGGHIGYGVEKACRGHHYAERACRLLFPLARRHGLTTLWITTNPDNLASRRTCERLGARLIEIVKLPTDTDQYPSGAREKCRYRLALGA